ncbi:MAG: hypothetical protein WCE68_17590 [Anaerolineales bacterium]
MTDITPGKAFYNRQVSFLEASDVPGLIASQYAPDAELVGYDLHVKGTQALLKHFTGYLANLGSIKVISTDKFMETEDAIMFEASIKVAAGMARVYDSFVLKDGKAVYHFTGILGFTPNS